MLNEPDASLNSALKMLFLLKAPPMVNVTVTFWIFPTRLLSGTTEVKVIDWACNKPEEKIRKKEEVKNTFLKDEKRK